MWTYPGKKRKCVEKEIGRVFEQLLQQKNLSSQNLIFLNGKGVLLFKIVIRVS